MVNYKDEFFENLLIVTAKFGKVFITDDGNMYRQQWQAESRMTDALRVHKQDLARVFAGTFAKSTGARNVSPDSAEQKADVPSMTLEEARAELARRRNSGQEGAKPGRKPASKV